MGGLAQSSFAYIEPIKVVSPHIDGGEPGRAKKPCACGSAVLNQGDKQIVLAGTLEAHLLTLQHLKQHLELHAEVSSHERCDGQCQ